MKAVKVFRDRWKRYKPTAKAVTPRETKKYTGPWRNSGLLTLPVAFLARGRTQTER